MFTMPAPTLLRHQRTSKVASDMDARIFVPLKLSEEVTVVKFSPWDPFLLAVGGTTSLYLIRIALEANKYIPTTLQTIPLSSRPISLSYTLPSSAHNTSLAVACSDQRIRYISTFPSLLPTGNVDRTEVTLFGSNRGRINEIQFCAIRRYEGYLGVVSDDKTLTIWNTATSSSSVANGDPDASILTITGDPSDPEFKRVPSSLHIGLPHPSPSISFSPHTAAHLAILCLSPHLSTIQIKDWLGHLNPQTPTRSTSHREEGRNPGETVLTLRAGSGRKAQGMGGKVQWHPSEKEVFGAVFADGKWAIWDLKTGKGGLPSVEGTIGDGVGEYRFRWAPNDLRLFAILDSRAGANPPLKVVSTSFPQCRLDPLFFPTCERRCSCDLNV
ncbi:hypothetical protein BT69DRAFT_184415 [Atractiella rhizophila]|nr:hypothetical protein BT69DRAFT_184415 [Atractiella rhizophila]